MSTLATYLSKLAAQGHSELLLCAGQPPMSQNAGTLAPLAGESTLDDTAVRKLVRDAVGESNLAVLGTRGMLDVVHATAQGRARCVCLHGEAGLSVLLRMLPNSPASCDALGIPDNVSGLASVASGLVIVAAPAGGGKTTLLAALVESLNASERKLIVKLDRQHELRHQNKLSVVSELEVGLHCETYEHGVRSALTMNADVIVVGELDAPGALSAALDASGQGALVIGAVRAAGAAAAINRLLSSIATESRAQARAAVAEACVGLVAQDLAPKKGGGRSATFEVFARSPAFTTALRDGKLASITGVRAGS